MGARHASTSAERVNGAISMLGCMGEYGAVTALSRTVGVSRQALYAWKDVGRRALEGAFAPTPRPVRTPALERRVLTLLVAGHASERGIQRRLAGEGLAVSAGAISAIVQEAERRALRAMERPLAVGPRVVALDEIYGNNRRGAYLSVVDARSGAVWATAGPVGVDAESWTLLLWAAQERGLRWSGTVSDGGAAIQGGCAEGGLAGQHQRDVWHVLHACSQVQGRLERWLAGLEAQTTIVARQAARVAAGRRPRGGRPKATDPTAHAAAVARARSLVAGLRYLTGELRRLLEVVVLTPRGLLDYQGRRAEVQTVLALLAEEDAGASVPQQAELRRLRAQLSQALPALLTFAAGLEPVQQEWGQRLGREATALVAWAWQRRAVLGPATEELLAGFPADWRPAARVLLHAWDTTVRASSLVENWHSLLRPHLAVHRTLSPGMLALLAISHNHQVAACGLHAGASPLQRSGIAGAITDWLLALGYPLAAAPPTVAPAPPNATAKEAA